MEIPYIIYIFLQRNGLPVLFGVKLFYSSGRSDTDFVPFAYRAFVTVFHRMQARSFHRFGTGAAIEHDVAAFGIEVLPLLTERGNVDEVVV